MTIFKLFYQAGLLLLFAGLISCEMSPPTAAIESSGTNDALAVETGYEVIEFNPGQLPKATIRATSYLGFPPLNIEFDASNCCGNIIQYQWKVEDGPAEVNVVKFEHTFNEPGVYIVRLSVLDDQNRLAKDLVKIRVLDPTKPTKYYYLLP